MGKGFPLPGPNSGLPCHPEPLNSEQPATWGGLACPLPKLSSPGSLTWYRPQICLPGRRHSAPWRTGDPSIQGPGALQISRLCWAEGSEGSVTVSQWLMSGLIRMEGWIEWARQTHFPVKKQNVCSLPQYPKEPLPMNQESFFLSSARKNSLPPLVCDFSPEVQEIILHTELS